MKAKWFCSRARRFQASNWTLTFLLAGMLGCSLAFPAKASAGDSAPQWMHALVNVPVPAHDEKTDAVLLYEEQHVNVISADKIKTSVRRAYKILRPSGREYGTLEIHFDSLSKVTSMRGWCIPAQGKDFEVKDKDIVEGTYPLDEGMIYPDLRIKTLKIPAPDPGNIVGYEYESEDQPVVLQDGWYFQGLVPVREARYSLQLPPGWEYKVSWRNYAQTEPSSTGGNSWQWVVTDVKEIRREDDMPPFSGVAGRMVISFLPPGGAGSKGFTSWPEMGKWYLDLTSSRLAASPSIKQKTNELTASAPSILEKMKKVGQFVQRDIRYVALEIGIGGWQPHPATDIFTNRYGDCKDKVTLMRSMLHELGVESYYVVVNTHRGSVGPETPAYLGAFNHAILAIRLPNGVDDPSLVSTMLHSKWGRLLFFDPTNELTPFGQISGNLQSNYALFVSPDGGELLQVPQQPSSLNSVRRTAKLALDANGTLRGDVEELRVGDRAWAGRKMQNLVTKDSERIKPIESLLAGSLSFFQISGAKLINLEQNERPFGFRFSLQAENYAKNSGGLLLVRPRIFGTKSSGILETKDPRKFPVEFDGPELDTDTFEITLPPGYVVDDIPLPVDVDYGFASYHSKTEVDKNVLRYTRTFEIKELSVPLAKVEQLKKFYRIIASDERSTAVLKPAGM